MRIALLSDLHREFWPDVPTSAADPRLGTGQRIPRDPVDGRAADPFVAEIVQPTVNAKADVVVLAGDIGTIHRETLSTALASFLDALPASTTVAYVPGNHEYVGTHSPQDLYALLAGLELLYPNFMWLRGDRPRMLHGRRWHGHTGWYRATPQAVRMFPRWFDSAYTPDGYAFAEHERFRKYLEAELQAGDVVVTHMLPHVQAIAPRWRSADTNCFFHSDFDQLVEQRKPALWMHGHTHDSIDVIVPGGTRIACNPYGYDEREVNKRWTGPQIIELD